MSQKKIIVIDARMVGPHSHGIARYVTQIAKGLSLRRKELIYTPIFLVSQSFTEDQFFGFRTRKVRASFLSLSELKEIPLHLKQLDADLYHTPSFSSLRSSPCPHLMTLHDLNHLHFGNIFTRIYYQTLLKPFAKKASHLMTVSRFSQTEIAQWLKISLKEISIVPNALDPKWLEPIDNEHSEALLVKHHLKKKQYFFCSSNLKNHKNLKSLLRNYSSYYREDSEAWPLVLTTQLPKKQKGVCSLGALSDSDLLAIAKNAAAVYCPAKYEGFGLSPLETLISGVPLVVSRIPAHEEALSPFGSAGVLWCHSNESINWTMSFHKIKHQEQPQVSLKTRETVLEHYSNERLIEPLLDVYSRSSFRGISSKCNM